MHELDIFHDHLTMSDEERAAIAQYIWNQENVELATIGIDIGSSTSHLLFAKVLLQRQSQGLSSRFVVVHRQVIWRSPIMLTPFLPDGTIDAGAARRFHRAVLPRCRLRRSDVDSGAVILTGEAIKRKNAQAIDELFAAEAGKFVCATAGPQARMHACRLRRRRGEALRGSRRMPAPCRYRRRHDEARPDRQRGVRRRVGVRGRRPARSRPTTSGAWSASSTIRPASSPMRSASRPMPKRSPNPEARHAIARRLATIAADYILGTAPDPLGQSLLLTPPLRAHRGARRDHVFRRRRRNTCSATRAADTATSPCCSPTRCAPNSKRAPRSS